MSVERYTNILSATLNLIVDSDILSFFTYAVFAALSDG